MSGPSSPLLALALDSANFVPERRVDPAGWLELVAAAERSGVGLVTLADTHRAADGVPRLDALMLAAYLGARTHRIGIVAAADTTVSEPYLLATQVATADFVSSGRAGWLVQVSGGLEDAGYVGPREAALGPAAWAEATEFVEVVRALWDSWEDDAEIRDTANHRFIDRQRIHHIDFEGEHLTIRGPSITPRSPQGQPPIAIAVRAADDGHALELAVTQADVVFLSDGVDPESLRAAAAERGRAPRLLLDLDLEPELDNVAAHDLRAEGFDGVRLIATALPGQLVDQLAKLGELGGPTGSATGSAPGAPGTLRDRLGLPRPPSRYAPAVSGRGSGR